MPQDSEAKAFVHLCLGEMLLFASRQFGLDLDHTEPEIHWGEIKQTGGSNRWVTTQGVVIDLKHPDGTTSSFKLLVYRSGTPGGSGEVLESARVDFNHSSKLTGSYDFSKKAISQLPAGQFL